MGTFTSLASWKAPDKPSIKKKVVLLIGVVPFKLGMVGERFCPTMIAAIYRSHHNGVSLIWKSPPALF
jgi:hypothetical protein